MTDETGDPSQPWAAYLLFVRYQHGDPVASGHVETPYLRFAATERGAREILGAMQLSDAVSELNRAIAQQSAETRPWWEAMNDESAE
jgi:hypothetical protein